MSEQTTTSTRSSLLYDHAAIDAALDRMAGRIDAHYAGVSEVLMLPVMVGGMIPASLLALRMRTPLTFDYVHATRYRGKTTGDARIDWLHWPARDLQGQHVLLVDDIIDEGATLRAIQARLCEAGVKSLRTAALVDKQHDRRVDGVGIDFVELKVPDEYVFGFGMDFEERFRNLVEIRALHD